MSHRSPLRKLVLPAIAAAAIGIAACGSDDEPVDSAAPPALATPDNQPELRQLEEPAAGVADPGTPSTTGDPGEALEQMRESFREAAASQLEQRGLSDEQVECVLPKLEASVDDGQLEQAMESGSFDDLRELGIEAAEECGAKLG